ncbi:hypothetical protein RRG08_030304 [Elysia crispata]|uniref:Uncharacterized protein n=1 Tax=Elysia crispata TaxID=231223 RepID=A0AAE0YI47_9GAST|nr:hypothetical protein RRG08_030304 [Elysia crispata]
MVILTGFDLKKAGFRHGANGERRVGQLEYLWTFSGDPSRQHAQASGALINGSTGNWSAMCSLFSHLVRLS